MGNDEYIKASEPKPEGYDEFEAWMTDSADEVFRTICHRGHSKTACLNAMRYLISALQKAQIPYLNQMSDHDQVVCSRSFVLLATFIEVTMSSPLYDDHMLTDQLQSSFRVILGNSDSIKIEPKGG